MQHFFQSSYLNLMDLKVLTWYPCQLHQGLEADYFFFVNEKKKATYGTTLGFGVAIS